MIFTSNKESKPKKNWWTIFALLYLSRKFTPPPYRFLPSKKRRIF
jgi:hypothetical protein